MGVRLKATTTTGEIASDFGKIQNQTAQGRLKSL